MRRRSAIRRKEKGFPKGKGKQPERVSLFPLVRLCLLSPHSESKCLPGTRASQKTICLSAIFSPLARYGQSLSLTSAYAASAYFRCTTKVGKGVQKREKTTVRCGFLLPLLNLPHLSTVRGSPPSLKRRWLTELITQRGSRAVGAVEIETSTSRELP